MTLGAYIDQEQCQVANSTGMGDRIFVRNESDCLGIDSLTVVNGTIVDFYKPDGKPDCWWNNQSKDPEPLNNCRNNFNYTKTPN